MKEEIFDKIIWHFGRLDEEDYQDARDASEEIAVLAAVKCIEISMTVAGAVPNYFLLRECIKEALLNRGFAKETIETAFELYNKNK